MQTVGQLFKKTREDKQLDLAYVEKLTKIRHKYLEALENDDYRVLPSAIAARGFIKNYGQVLGLPNDTLQALFRRDFLETETGQVIPRGMVRPLDKPDSLLWTPKRTAALFVGIIVLALSLYFTRQLIILNSAPSLKINLPVQDETLTTHEVLVRGQTDPDVSVVVNGQVAQVDGNGIFKTTVKLPSGRNSITVIATSKSNKITRLSRAVNIR